MGCFVVATCLGCFVWVDWVWYVCLGCCGGCCIGCTDGLVDCGRLLRFCFGLGFDLDVGLRWVGFCCCGCLDGLIVCGLFVCGGLNCLLCLCLMFD